MSLLTLLSTAAAGIAYTLTADVGAFAVAGQPATLNASTRLTADVGSFALAGQPADLRAGKSITGDVGTFSLVGNAVRFNVARASSVGSFTLTGQAAGLQQSKNLTSSVGTFILTGQSALLPVARNVTGDVGAFTLTGQSANLRFGKFVVGSVGAFTLTGQSATLRLQRNMVSAVGAFTLTGQDAILLGTNILSGGVGAFALTGQNASLLAGISQLGKSQVRLFPSPTNSVGVIDSNTVRSNDNITVQALNAHDANASIHIQSGLLATRPASSTQGATYFCIDTRDTYTYVSSAWVQSGWAHWYCAFSDYTDQTIATINTPTKVTFNTTDLTSGFSLVSSSRMTAAYAGNYDFQWSGQFANPDSQEHAIDVWIRINGVDVVGSAGRVSILKKHGSIDGHVLPGWNYFLTLAAGDYVELYWAASSTLVKLEHKDASAWAPSTASIIATMTRV